MSFLRCNPSVFVIDNEYEIAVWTKENGMVWITVDGYDYYAENSGVLASEVAFTRVRIPQNVLNNAKKYEIVYRKSIDRKAYFSEFAPPERAEFDFKSIEKQDNINIYHVADVHYQFEKAVKMCGYFGEQTDLFIVNGDIGEVETEENYFEVVKFTGDISQGKIPVLFVRGNHDTRGRLAELFTDYFPSNDKKTYFEFSVGPIGGVALDCGEDKRDDGIEYGGIVGEIIGTNNFHRFRLKETGWLKTAKVEGKYKFAVAHICPSQTTYDKGNVFDIERDIYSEWNEQIDRLGIKLMICGHMHDAYLLPAGDERSTIAHNYDVVFGSRHRDTMWGCAMTLSGKDAIVRFTDEENEVQESFTLKEIF